MEIRAVNEVLEWIDGLDTSDNARVVHALDLLAEFGPGLGRPLVDSKERSTGESERP